MTWRSFHRWRRGIGPRLLVRVLLFSSAITLLLTSFQLYFEYRYAVRAIESRMAEIEGSYLQSLAGSLWNLDSRQIELQIEGILRLPAMRFVEVRETTDRANPLMVSVGHRQEHAALRRVFSLVHTSRGDPEQLGVLSIEATFDEVYRALLQRAIIILVRDGTEIFLVSFFILSLTHRFVTRHLTALAGFLGTYDVRQPPPPLRLQRRAPKDKDELDQVLAAFERMRQSLERGYEALQESEQRFRDYAETASDWFWATGLDHAFTYFSEHASFRRDWGTLIGKCRWDVAADVASEPEHWRQHMATLERHEPFRDFGYQVRYVDGTLGFVSISGKPVWDAEGRFAGYRGVARDITERQRAEEALRRSEAFLAEGQKLSHAGSWSFKPDGTCDYWSRELYQILGFDPNGGIPTIPDYLTRVHPQDREVVGATIQRMIAAGEGCDLKKRIIRPDGVQRVIRCVGMPVREEGVVTRFVGTLMDITEQEELTQELRRREACLSEAQRLSHTGSFAWNIVTGERTWSEEAYRILAYDPSVKPTSERMRDRVHPDDLQMWEEAGARAAEGKEVDFEPRLLMLDGSVKHLHVVAYGFQKDGKYVELFGIAMDITERKRAEETLRQSEAYLAEAQRLSQTGSWAWSPNTDVRYWSEECYRILGFDPRGGLPRQEELIQRIHPDDQPAFRESAKRARHTKLDEVVDYRIVHPGGALRHIHSIGHPVFSPRGDLIELTGTVIDVTERKRAEEAIRRSEAFLAEGQRISHTGSWGWNASTGKLTWSQEHFRILGLDPQNTNPSLDVFWERVHPDDRIGLQRAFESAMRDKRDFEQEFRIVTPDSSTRYVHGVGHAILNKANELVEFIGSTMDITERKRDEAALQETRAELERVTRVTTMGELAASIAHEINQPLAGVVTSANAGLNWLAANPPNLSKTRETLERILRDGTRGGDVLARIRALLKRTPPAKTLVSVNQIVRDVLALTAGELRQHQIELSLELAPTVPAVLGDTVQLQQVLLNLIKNAIEAMTGIVNGQRTLRIQSRVGELDGKPGVTVQVSDTGIGLSGSDNSRLFEAFHTTKPQGMGMGLWISRSIIESHHGRLTASTGDGPGATFVIMLPTENPEQA